MLKAQLAGKPCSAYFSGSWHLMQEHLKREVIAGIVIIHGIIISIRINFILISLEVRIIECSSESADVNSPWRHLAAISLQAQHRDSGYLGCTWTGAGVARW